MRSHRALLAALMALVFYTATDILVWQRIFESNQLIEYADAYHLGWFASLAGYAAVGVVILAGHWKDCVFYVAALFVGAFSGLEDVLYYALDRRPMPAALPWLDGNPLILNSSRAGVIGSVVVWLLVLAILYAVLFRHRIPGGNTRRRAAFPSYTRAAGRQKSPGPPQFDSQDGRLPQGDRTSLAAPSTHRSST